MPELLLELFSEEIPARMQEAAAKDLERLVVGALSDRGLMFEGAKAFSGPRRLTLSVLGLPAKQPDVSEEKKGPRVGAPEKAIEGFLRSAGVTLDQCEKRNDGKGEFYVAVIARKGRATAEVLAELLPETIGKLPWPKSMRWTAGSTRWVRPLHSIICTFDGEVVPFEFANVKSGNATRGHRFLSHGHIEVRRYEDYEKKLRSGHVVLDAADRKDIIRHELKQQAFALGLELIEDEGLLNEVAGLAEWPVVLIGKIEDQFMDVPPEILQTSMRTHQKYFALRDPKTGKLANRFALVSNMIAHDGGKQIVAGNERVLRARLSDAKFFWDQDCKRTLESRVEDLKNIVFHAEIGTQYERVQNIELLAAKIAQMISLNDAGIENSIRAAYLCKADLTTGVVGEFPELQGIMGGYYALHDNENVDAAYAIQEHYAPLGPGDEVPTAPVSIVLALADKFNTLVGFFAVQEFPTGSRDPYGLRRAAIGIIRIILTAKVRLSLQEVITEALAAYLTRANAELEKKAPNGSRFRATDNHTIEMLLAFFVDRLKVVLREIGVRHDLIDAVLAQKDAHGIKDEFSPTTAIKYLGVDDVFVIARRVEALQSFLKTEDGANLLVAYRRASNILKAEEKKEGALYNRAPDSFQYIAVEEKSLAEALAAVETRIVGQLNFHDFVEAMSTMASLRAPVDAFFDKVTVNAPEPELRRNRLLLLSRLRATLHLVADFSKIEG